LGVFIFEKEVRIMVTKSITNDIGNLDIYDSDSDLAKLYKVKLLIPGWAGQVNDAEAKYIAIAIVSDRKLRSKWRRALKSVGVIRMMRRPSIEAIRKWVMLLE
jgi:hypothetical protein